MPDDLSGFRSAIKIEVGATVTHPPGTTFDDEGKPIPPIPPKVDNS